MLFLLPDFPYPPSTGGRLKVFNELLYLSNRHQCDVLCFGKVDEAQLNGLAAVLPRVGVLGVVSPRSGVRKWLGVLWHLVRLLPPSLTAFSKRDYARAVRDSLATGNYDVVHYDIINMAQYLSLGSGKPSVHSPNDATSLVYFRMAEHSGWSLAKIRLLLSAVLLRRFERKMYPLFTKVHVVSEPDAVYLKRLDPRIDVETIPISIDRVLLTKANMPCKRNIISEHAPKIVCTGNLGNAAIAQGVEDFLRYAYPRILREVPNVRLVVLGQNASASLLRRYKGSANIEFCPWVDDYRDFISQADVVLAPDSEGASGAKTRVVQAMVLGLTVVGSETAFEGIPAINGVHGMVYTSMAECSAMILTLLSNKELCERIGKKAHQLAIAKFSLSEVGPKYESLYLDAISRHHSVLHGKSAA